MQTISIIVPIYNEAPTLRILLDLVWQQDIFSLNKEIIIVESRSTDGSREICEEFFQRHKQSSRQTLKVILEDQPKGKGHAVRAGLRESTGDIILIQDGDLEYRVEEYPQLIEPILNGKSDVVLGSRHMSAGHWKIRKFGDSPFFSTIFNLGGIFFHSLFNFVYGVRLTDPTTMFKVFRRNCIEGISLQANRFDFDFELLGKIIRNGYEPLEVPISYVSRGYNEGKKVSMIRDPLLWIWAILKYRFVPLRNQTTSTQEPVIGLKEPTD